MKTMTYRGYTAEIVYSDEDESFVGRIVNIDAISGFHGDTDEELRVAFEDMVDLYIRTREAPENLPQKPYLRRFLAPAAPSTPPIVIVLCHANSSDSETCFSIGMYIPPPGNVKTPSESK